MRIIAGTAHSMPAGLLFDIARYRHRVFVERLGWRLHTTGQLELDEFDRRDTCYIAAIDAGGAVIGTARLLPTRPPVPACRCLSPADGRCTLAALGHCLGGLSFFGHRPTIAHGIAEIQLCVTACAGHPGCRHAAGIGRRRAAFDQRVSARDRTHSPTCRREGRKSQRAERGRWASAFCVLDLCGPALAVASRNWPSNLGKRLLGDVVWLTGIQCTRRALIQPIDHPSSNPRRVARAAAATLLPAPNRAIAFLTWK